MKTSTAILSIMATASLVFSVAAFLVVANNCGLFTLSNPTATPTPYTLSPAPLQTNTPQPTTSNTALTINYEETSREENNDFAKITLTVTATYQNGDPITIDYSQFYLKLYVFRMINPVYDGTANCPNTGTLTLGPHHTTQTFQLQYEYDTMGFNGMDPSRVYYQLECNGTVTIDWANQTRRI